MLHKSVAINGSDLLSQIMEDTDTPWREVLDFDCPELDQLWEIDDPTVEQQARIDELESQCAAEVAAHWYSVSWPQHVLTPRFNNDANYGTGQSEAEARAISDVVFGEFSEAQ